MWQVAGFGRWGELYDRQAAHAQPAPGFSDACPLPEMSVKEEVAADFQFTGVSSGPHPMSFLRESLTTRGVISAEQLSRLSGGQRVRIAGLVIVRQRPGTAKGLVFLTLEDETGFANAMVSAADFERHRLLLIRAHALIVEGTVQRHEGVISLRAGGFTAIQDEEMQVAVSHDFY